ncbi:hypothetical protein BHE74_00028705 [Ensete ventricosum]|nr:hypothetical protein GW17_00043509 [Ensete ventricosum]RWW64079.1 hypothetical protein BHE74_00028705 [Ensete ventricosum]RZS00516.1 hypothetical protein BHM03_00030219 [Ensete ventricosum]
MQGFTYRAVRPKSTIGDRLKEKSTVDGQLGKKREEEKKKEEEEKYLARTPSPPGGRLRAVAARERFLSSRGEREYLIYRAVRTVHTARYWYHTGTNKISVHRYGPGTCHHVAHHSAARYCERHLLLSQQVQPYLVSHLPAKEAEIGEAGGGGEGELDHHIVSATGGGIGEEEVGSNGDEDMQEEEE